MITSVRGQIMLEYLPEYYAASRVMQAIMQADGAEFDKLRQALDGTLDQFFVDTATWGLDIQENELGIKIDPNKPADQRRSVILSKRRGIGTVTTGLIESVAEAYLNGEVDVAVNSPAYEVTITFIGERGIPPNLDDIKNAINEIIPAHLLPIYKITYLYWDELDNGNRPWNQIEVLSWDALETAFIN